MSYFEDTIDWQAVHNIDIWLDDKTASIYKDQPLAQDWARVSKIGEEYGEAIQCLIGITGQNPRKGITHIEEELLKELADVMISALMAIQHFTKDTQQTRDIIRDKLRKIESRVNNYGT